MHSVIDLDGVVVARGLASGDGITLQLCSPSGFSEAGTYYPAESLQLATPEAVVALWNLLSDLLAAYNDAQETV